MYAIYKGDIYCISGGRKHSDWYKNVLANPETEIILPGGAIYGRVTETSGNAERLVVIRQILKNARFAGFFEGYNPFTITDEELARKSADLPLLRIQPIGIANGVSDPGGWAWIWLWTLTAVVVVLLVR